MNPTNQPPLWRSIFLTIGLIGGIWLLVQWLLYPGYLLLNTSPLPQLEHHTPLPSPKTMEQLKRYHHISKMSPFLRPLVSSYVASILSHQIHPARIERSFRQTLLKDSLSAWFRRFAQWESLLQQLEAMFPQFHVEAYRAYLYLQAGQLRRLQQWGQHLPKQTPQQRQQALLHTWIGHACFLAGWTEQAEQHYQQVLQAFDQNPGWDQRTAHNWRLPAEHSTVLYHAGLLALRRGDSQKALGFFRQLQQRWQTMHKPTHTLPLWYSSHLWSVQACRKLSDTRCVQQHLQQANTFTTDQTLIRMTKARSLPASDDIWTALITKPQNHAHSYTDSPLISRLYLALQLLREHKKTAAYSQIQQIYAVMQKRTWSPTLGMLQRRDTRNIRYLPAAPVVYSDLIDTLEQSLLVKPASQPAYPTTTSVSPPQLIELSQPGVWLRELRMYRALSYLKLYAWEQAEQQLQQILRLYPHFSAPHFYLGLLALAQGQFDVAYRSFVKYYQDSHHSVGLVYITYAAIQSRSPSTKTWLAQLKKAGVSSVVVQRLENLEKHKPWGQNTKKAELWWRTLGAEGLLATYDPHLERRSQFWQLRELLFHPGLPQQFFRTLGVSHWVSRHSLSTWLARYRYLALLFPRQKTEYLRRLQYIQSYYHFFPHHWYLLDRTMYSHHWGLMALGFY